jgi:methanol--5-hydroxybenzimidazolylcobamide Co-methyltransferase
MIMSIQYNHLAYTSLDDFIYGRAPHPVTTRNGLVIGGGTVYPEVNFTLPSMTVTTQTMPEVKKVYQEMIDGVLKRAHELHAPGLVVELELLPPMTEHPEWGIEIHKLVRSAMFEFEAKHGLKSAMRITPNDLREMNRPPVMRGGAIWDRMLESFERCALDGADFLAIESTGGKELHDDALVNVDLRTILFSLGVLGVRDMRFLWSHLSRIARETHSIPSGDSACAFGNTAMVLAERGFIPKVVAAVVRVATVPRALVACEEGAVGPSKDCAYEGPFLKAIAGIPISMEGRSAACAHLSPLGNIAAAVADLWSNESVQQVKLLSGMAPVVSTEQLVYDCRMMNVAAAKGQAVNYRDLLTESDAGLDPQAYVLKPEVVFAISEQLVQIEDPFLRTKRAAQIALETVRNAIDRKEVLIADREYPWLDRMSEQIETIPDDADAFWHEMQDEVDLDKFIPAGYGLAVRP